MTATSPPMSLTLFTTTQSPLPVRYQRPPKPSLLLPPLIHRTLHTALDSSPVSAQVDVGAGIHVTIPHTDTIAKHDIPSSADQSAHELTVKVHLVADAQEGGPAERARWVEDSLRLLREVKGLGGVDNLLVGFRGIDYKGKKSAASGWGDWGCDTDYPEETDTGAGAAATEGGSASASSPTSVPSASSSASSSDVVPEQLAKDVEQTWAALEHLQQQGSETEGAADVPTDRVRRLGTLYMPLGMLERLAQRPVPPRINAMDTPDCHHLPKEYSDFARSKGIELWAGGGGEGADPLPAADLHNLLQEFYSHLEEILPENSGSTFQGLATQIPVENGRWASGPKRGVSVRWVLGYTLLSSTRNLVTDKGYIISADLLGA